MSGTGHTVGTTAMLSLTVFWEHTNAAVDDTSNEHVCTFRIRNCFREEEVRTNQALEELGAKHEKAMTELSQSYDVLVSEEIEKAKQEAAEKSETRINNTRDLYEQQLQVGLSTLLQRRLRCVVEWCSYTIAHVPVHWLRCLFMYWLFLSHNLFV